MLKKITALGMALLMALTVFILSVSASEYGLNYLYTYDCGSYLSISSLNATCTSDLNGYIGTTTKIEVTQTLQVKDGNHWRTSQSWTATYNSYTCDFVNTRTVYSGNTYRVKSEFKVYSGSSYETITVYSSTKTT